MNITPSTCYYVTASQLGKISKETAEAIDALFNSDLDVSFGDANRTLIDIPHFLHMLENGMEQQGIFWNSDDDVHEGFNLIKEALDGFSKDVYIDLEN